MLLARSECENVMSLCVGCSLDDNHITAHGLEQVKEMTRQEERLDVQ